MAELDGSDFRLPLNHRVQENLDLSGTAAANLETPLEPNNIGYKLLQKLAWNPGACLGRGGHGKANLKSHISIYEVVLLHFLFFLPPLCPLLFL